MSKSHHGKNDHIALFLFFLFSLQFSLCVFQSSSSLDFYLKSTHFSCVCWSRLTCTCLVELVRNQYTHTWTVLLFSPPSNLSLCFSHYKPPVLTLQSVTQCVSSSSGIWLLPWCYQCKWAILSYKESYRSWFYHVMMHILLYCIVHRPHGVRLMFQCSSLYSVASSLPYHTT